MITHNTAERIMDAMLGITKPSFRTVIKQADTILKGKGNRSEYAVRVLHEHEPWSGSGLRGKALAHGVHYKEMRDRAEEALIDAGGLVLRTERGRKLPAIYWKEDDTGSRYYVTSRGIARLDPTKQWAKHIKRDTPARPIKYTYPSEPKG